MKMKRQQRQLTGQCEPIVAIQTNTLIRLNDWTSSVEPRVTIMRRNVEKRRNHKADGKSRHIKELNHSECVWCIRLWFEWKFCSETVSHVDLVLWCHQCYCLMWYFYISLSECLHLLDLQPRPYVVSSN